MFISTPTAAQSGWEKDDVRDGITILRKEMPGSVDAMRGIILLPYSPDEVLEVLADVGAYNHFMPNVKKSRKLSDTTVDGVRQIFHYTLLSVATLDDRDYVVSVKITGEGEGAKRTWSMTFQAVKGKVAPTSGVVRLTVVNGSWQLRPAKNGAATQLTYTSHIEFGGNLPDFVVNSNADDGVVEMLQSVRGRCASVHKARAKK